MFDFIRSLNINMSEHYQKYRNTIRKVARRHRRLKDKWINEIWVKKHLKRLKEKPDVRYVNKFLGLLACEVWYRLFITKEISSEDTLD